MTNLEPIEQRLHSLLISRGERLSVAESCTGGGIASRIVALAGSSQYFEGGVVAYSNASKSALLSVPVATIERYGAVSQEVALAMADGVRGAFAATYSVVTTGVAGPTGGSPEKPIGTVWFAISTPKRNFAWQSNCGSERAEVIANATTEALSRLFEELQSEK